MRLFFYVLDVVISKLLVLHEIWSSYSFVDEDWTVF
jgi:hypothetical protein